MPITLETTLSRNGDILYASTGTGEAVMMSIEEGRYYGLNTVASRIWELLETPKTVAQLCAQLSEEFEVEAKICEAEVLTFTNGLIEDRIVHEAPA